LEEFYNKLGKAIDITNSLSNTITKAVISNIERLKLSLEKTFKGISKVFSAFKTGTKEEFEHEAKKFIRKWKREGKNLADEEFSVLKAVNKDLYDAIECLWDTFTKK